MTSRTLPWLITPRHGQSAKRRQGAATSSIVTPAVLRRTDFFGLSNARSFVLGGAAARVRRTMMRCPGPGRSLQRRMLTPLLRAVGTHLWALLVLLACAGGARAEDGYALWMRYQPVAATVAAITGGNWPKCGPGSHADAARHPRRAARSLPGLLGAAPPNANGNQYRACPGAGHAAIFDTRRRVRQTRSPRWATRAS